MTTVQLMQAVGAFLALLAAVTFLEIGRFAWEHREQFAALSPRDAAFGALGLWLFAAVAWGIFWRLLHV